MAQHGSAYRGSTTYGLQRSDDCSSRASHDPDHVCRPVLIDAEGRKRPIIVYSSYQTKENYVTKPEGVVPQLVNKGLASEYKQGHQRTPDPREGYGAVEDRRRKSATIGDNDTLQKVEDFISAVQKLEDMVSEVQQLRATPPGYDRQQQADNLVTAKAQPGAGRPGYDLQQQVDGLAPRVQTEASRPRLGHMSSNQWRQTPSTGYNDNTGAYGEYNNNSINKERQTAGGYESQNGENEDYYRRDNSIPDRGKVTPGVWRPNPSTWASRPSGNTAYSQYPEPAYKETIDSTEAARRYGNYKLTPRPFSS